MSSLSILNSGNNWGSSKGHQMGGSKNRSRTQHMTSCELQGGLSTCAKKPSASPVDTGEQGGLSASLTLRPAELKLKETS